MPYSDVKYRTKNGGRRTLLWAILENLRSASVESHEVDNLDILCLSRLFVYLDKLVWQ